MISDPYQQYEKRTEFSSSAMVSALLEIYAYEKEGLIYDDMRLDTYDNDSMWMVGNRTAKISDLYAVEGLDFKFSRKEKTGDFNAFVFTTQYETMSITKTEDKSIETPCNMKLEYYVDPRSREIVRIVVDDEEVAREGAIAMKITEGETKENAAKIVQKEGVEKNKIVIDIKNLGGEFVIHRPDTSE